MENMRNVDFIMREDYGYGSDSHEISTGGREPLCGNDVNAVADEYPSVSRFWQTKRYLHRVRDGIRRCGLLEQRISLRQNDPDGSLFPDTDKLDRKLKKAKQDVNHVRIEVTDLISKLPDVNQQVVITERYVNLKSWEEIAEELHTSVRIVQKIHGRALPLLEELIWGNTDGETTEPV